MPADKTKEDRLGEGLELLRALLRTGVGEDEPAYLDMKSKISEWVNTGVSWEGRIDFPDHGRYANIRLPKNSINTATLAFKMKKGSYPNPRWAWIKTTVLVGIEPTTFRCAKLYNSQMLYQVS